MWQHVFAGATTDPLLSGSRSHLRHTGNHTVISVSTRKQCKVP